MFAASIFRRLSSRLVSIPIDPLSCAKSAGAAAAYSLNFRARSCSSENIAKRVDARRSRSSIRILPSFVLRDDYCATTVFGVIAFLWLSSCLLSRSQVWLSDGDDGGGKAQSALARVRGGQPECEDEMSQAVQCLVDAQQPPED